MQVIHFFSIPTHVALQLSWRWQDRRSRAEVPSESMPSNSKKNMLFLRISPDNRSLSSLQLEKQGAGSSHAGIFCVVRNLDSNDYLNLLHQHLEKDPNNNSLSWVVFTSALARGWWKNRTVPGSIPRLSIVYHFQVSCARSVSSVGRAWC